MLARLATAEPQTTPARGVFTVAAQSVDVGDEIRNPRSPGSPEWVPVTAVARTARDVAIRTTTGIITLAPLSAVAVQRPVTPRLPIPG